MSKTYRCEKCVLKKIKSQDVCYPQCMNEILGLTIKARAKVVCEVIETIENRADVFDNDHMYEHGETVKDVAKELRKKYGVK